MDSHVDHYWLFSGNTSIVSYGEFECFCKRRFMQWLDANHYGHADKQVISRESQFF